MEKIKTMNFYLHGLCFLSQSSPLCDRMIQLNFTADYTDGRKRKQSEILKKENNVVLTRQFQQIRYNPIVCSVK